MPKRATVYLDDKDLANLEALRQHYMKLNPHLPKINWNTSNLVGIALAIAVHFEVGENK